MNRDMKFPEIRRDNATGTIVVRLSGDMVYAWHAIWAWTTEMWHNYTDEQVATWPILNPEHYIRERDDHRRTRRSLRRQNGRLSHTIGELRAQLARERERRRAMATQNRDAQYWGDELDRLMGMVREQHEREEGEKAKESTIVELKVFAEPEIDETWTRYLPKFDPAEVSAALHSLAQEREEKPAPEPWPRMDKACYVTPLGTPVHVKAWCKCRERRRLLWE